jgi:type VI protein secretion system component VasF
MADKEHYTEQIKYLTELLRLTWLTVIATIGGSVSVLLGETTTVRFILAGAGFLVTLGLLVIGWRLNHQIRALIARLKEVP